MRRLLKRALFWGLSSTLALATGAFAQDIEMLGKHHGTRPPQGYYDRMAKDPEAFQFQRALIRRGLGLRELPRVEAGERGRDRAYAMAMGEALSHGSQRVSVTGDFKFPLILGLYSDSDAVTAAYSRDAVQAEFFDGPQANPAAAGTVPEFYGEISGGRVSLSGLTYDWIRTSLTQAEVTAGGSGLSSDSRVGEFMLEIIQELDDGTVDWGQFDNDGPDGIPNSGDDDGYVDVLTLMHPDPGGECNTSGRDDRIWSHRWNLSALAGFENGPWRSQVQADGGWATSTPATPSAANPGNFPTIRILDYTVQPVTNCSGTLPNTIGVFAHELGHGLGLPDLYGTYSDQNGIGNWGLMGTGSWGCNGFSSELPCHMSAWSKEFLGWADVETLALGADLGTLSLPPVETTGKVFRIDAGDGSGEYFLLENRQQTLFDVNLYAPGLLVWHVDPEQIARRWSSNTINDDGAHHGVWLRQADGLNDLNRDHGGRGDAGDPYPGSSLKLDLHAATNPGSWSHQGGAMGITLMDVQQVGSDMTFQVVTGYLDLTLETIGNPSGNGLISVDGATSQDPSWVVESAPFQTHTVTAAPGEETGTGYRVGFQEWEDGSPRVREFQSQLTPQTLTASYGGTEVQIDVDLLSPVPGVSPGSIEFTPGDEEGWVSEGETVLILVEARTGFDFIGWTGALAGHPNPTTVVADLPLAAGADFDLTFSTSSNPSQVEVAGATDYLLVLEVENANPPVTWSQISGELPDGMGFDPLGRIEGAAMARGTFPVGFRVEDAIGLVAEVSLELVVEDPVISVERLASPFLLSGTVLDPAQKTYLDRAGNVNGSYDLGDFRSFYLRNPNLPSSGDLQGIIELLVPMGDMKSGGSEKEVIR